MTKKMLQQIRRYDNELKLLRRHLAALEESMGISSPNLDGQPRGSRISKPTEQQAVILADTIMKIRTLEERIQTERAHIWEYILTIPDTTMRQIIILRFIDGKSWLKVAAAIGGDATADGCRMAFNRANIDD